MVTDNETIKALEYCLAQGITSECERCRDKIGCRDTLLRNALDLIIRQKAEIETLEEEVRLAHNVIKRTFLLKAGLKNDPFAEIRAKERKEFWERLKSQNTMDERIISVQSGDNLLAEMESGRR